ncbi:MAG TPA: outer membrane lipoprotein-sorting protein, partial [Chryseolinea sp.]|nr:outer membrane lipoprotein-sorting protein [Chryseolinea sp.]
MKLKSLALAMALICGFASYAQTADEIIAKYFENTGGIEKWKSLEGLKMSAKLSQGGMEFQLEMIQLKDGRQMTMFNLQGKEVKQNVYDGTTLWS